jgi:mono/diheme cytochrome c family protein
VFIAVCIGLFLSQMTAVFLLAELGEEDEPEAAETQPSETETGTTETTTTETTGTETTGTETTETTQTTETSGTQGDAAAGKAVFTGSAGCTGCHTLADAGATGTIGPNLDEAMPSYDKVVERVTKGKAPMPSFKDTLTEQQIQDVAAYVSSVAGS